MADSFDEFLRQRNRPIPPTAEHMTAAKKILNYIVGEAFNNYDLNITNVQLAKPDLEVSKDIMLDVFDRLHKAFYDLADKRNGSAK